MSVEPRVIESPLTSMPSTSPSSKDSTVLERLRGAGLRPTRQRMALAKLLFSGGHRHVTAESLFKEAKGRRVNLSLATVYNALNDFTERGLLREISVETGSSYFDTNTSDHHHFYFERSGKLQDVDLDMVRISSLPEAPAGEKIKRVDVVIRLAR
jgi:Fur family iron response transcriptional regulator